MGKTESDRYAQLVEIQSVVSERVKFPASQAAQILEILPEIPIHVARGQEVFLNLAGKTLTLSSTAGLHKIKLDPGSVSISEIKTEPGEISLKVSGLAGVSTIVVKYDPTPIPARDITSLAIADAPVDLLDQYTALRVKGTLTPEEESRMSDLIKEIAKGFREREERITYTSRRRSITSGSSESHGGYSSRAAG